jgi:nucleotide-binding universal stress UspA family protein
MDEAAAETDAPPTPGRGAPRPVIVGYDGRDASRDAIALADVMATSRRDPLVAAHVSEALHPFGRNDRRRQHDVMDRLHLLRGVVDEVLPHRGADRVVGLRDVAAHSASRGLHDLASGEGARAIVLGSTHHGPVGRVAVGSTAARLLLGAPCHVAVAPLGFRDGGHRPLEKIAVAIDGCPDCQGALREAMSLTSALAGSLVALSVAPPRVVKAPAQHTAERLLDDVESMLERSGARNIERRLLEGRPATAIARAANDFDLLVLGCRAVGGPLGHPTLRSVSRELMHNSRVPVIVVPAQVPADAPATRPA